MTDECSTPCGISSAFRSTTAPTDTLYELLYIKLYLYVYHIAYIRYMLHIEAFRAMWKLSHGINCFPLPSARARSSNVRARHQSLHPNAALSTLGAPKADLCAVGMDGEWVFHSISLCANRSRTQFVSTRIINKVDDTNKRPPNSECERNALLVYMENRTWTRTWSTGQAERQEEKKTNKTIYKYIFLL